MATFDFTITEASVGQTIGPPYGFVTDIKMTTPPVHEIPDHDPVHRHHTSQYFCIRGERDHQNLVNVEPLNNPGAFSWGGSTGTMLINRSLAYRGGLQIIAVPKSSVWKITLSDAPIVRTPAGSGLGGLLATIMRERELIASREAR